MVETSFLDLAQKKYSFSDSVDAIKKIDTGLTEETVKEISRIKNEPKWMLDLRLNALKIFNAKPMPSWGADLSALNFDKITYYASSSEKSSNSWEDVPEKIKQTFERLGIPEAERKFLAGAGAMYESETVYHKLREDLEKQGVVFLDMDTALKEHEELVKKYFSTVVPVGDNKFASLNSAFWSGGSFVYVPKGVKVDKPLQAYFRINKKNMGQFERTLIIVDEDAEVHYIEGCSAPSYSTDSLHAAVVEVIAHKNSRVRYTTLQNWSSNVYNLVTKRAVAHENAYVEWLDANIGAKATMKYPCVVLKGEKSNANILSVAFANRGQVQDTGAKAIHMAPNTSSKIISKSVSKNGGASTYRGLLRVAKNAKNSKGYMRCDAIILDDASKADAIPSLDVNENDVSMGHEATVGKISREQLFYLMSRGLTEDQATTMIVAGFFEEFTKNLPLEYAVEFNRLISMEMEGSVG